MAKKRAAAYIRVSSASAGQTHSYEFQEQYWRGRFVNDEDVELVGIYADKGISGSSIYKRPQFLMMMQDARDGRFDVIYSKSVSRFSRNTVDFLTAIRELRELGIEVIFEKENIHTLQPTSELFLTIAAAIAENDLQVDSERQRWSIKHRVENGWISVGNGMFGYRMAADNQLEIVPEEAEIVREIYARYIAGEGSQKLANYNGPQEIDHIFQINREHGKIDQRKRKESILCHEGNTHRNLRPRSFWRYSRESGSWEPLLRRTT